MKLNRRIFTLTATAALAISTSMSFAGEALDRVMAAGVLKVATDANWAPQSFIMTTIKWMASMWIWPARLQNAWALMSNL